jgi:hypothetical protein
MKNYRKQTDKDSFESKELFERLNTMYAHIHELGYRKMPDQMYLEWLRSLSEQQEFQNQSIETLSRTPK